MNVFLTYMGDRYLELEDVDNVHLKLHPLVYTNKTWTPRKLLFRMRRDVILDVLSQVGSRRLTFVYPRRVLPDRGKKTLCESLRTIWWI